jgi:hypothetical protein
MEQNQNPTQPEPSNQPQFDPNNIYPEPAAGSVVRPAEIQPEAGTPPTPSQPVAPVATVYGPAPGPAYMNPGAPGDVVATSLNDSPRGKFGGFRSNKFFIPVVAAVILLGGSAAAYFGYYQPNQPANIWNSALTNTGKGYDKLTDYATSYDASKGSSIKGGFKLSGDIAADGTITGSSDGQNSDVSGSVSAVGLKVNYAVKTIKSAGNTPDVYFKVDGLTGLGDLLGSGDPTLTQGINSLNGQWYFIDHSLFDQFAKGANTDTSFSSADAKSVLSAVGSASKQYIFTNDQSKQAFTMNQAIGREKQDGRSVYHYKVGVNKQNLKAYVTALCGNIKSSSLKKLFGGDEKQTEQAIGCDNASASIDKMNTNGTADAWVDTHTKLIHKVRFSDKTNPSNYFDVGQDYQGGDSFPFELGFSEKTGSDSTNGSMKLTLNTKTNVFDVSGEGASTGSTKTNASFNLTISPSTSKVSVTAPAGAKNLIQLLNDMGLGSLFSDGAASAGTNAKDTERKTDVNALQGQIEAYYAQNGSYPSYAQLNDGNWRQTNLYGLDEQAVADPDGTAHFASAPAASVYAYQPTPGGCDNVKTQCTGYTLTATLSDGTTYAKKDLNSPEFQSG